MKRMKFRFRFKNIHEETGRSAYSVAKEAGMSQTTVRKYVYSDEVLANEVPLAVVNLAKVYGRNWTDPQIVDVVEVEAR